MITVRDVTLRRGTKVVLDNTSVTLQPGEKIGLVGRNGAGKSSLFSLLTNRLQSDAGEVTMPPRWLVGEVAQSMPETDQPATDFVLEGDTRLMAANAALLAAEAADDGHAMAEAQHLAVAFGAIPAALAQQLGLGSQLAASGRNLAAGCDVIDGLGCRKFRRAGLNGPNGSARVKVLRGDAA